MKYRLLTAALLTATLGAGCRAKLALDNQVDGIVTALSECDHPALDEEIASGLADELDQKFAGMCETIQWFGPLENRRQTSIHVSQGQSKGTYELEFEKGELQLELVLTDGDITMFEFSGDDWKKAKKEIFATKYAEFKVLGFDWLDPNGAPHAAGNKYAPGKVTYRLGVGGIEAKDGKFNLEVTTTIRDAQGKQMWRSPKPDVLSFDQDEDGIVRSGTVNGSVTIPDQGTFQIEYEIHDVNAGETIKYTQAVIVE